VFAAAALEQRVAQRRRVGELRELATKAQILLDQQAKQ
jgi:hypothetical protein